MNFVGDVYEKSSYGVAIRLAFEYLLETYPEVFVIGQGLWVLGTLEIQ